MVDGLQNKKIAYIIQARMQSARLPGKILLPMPIHSDVSLLGRIIHSLKNAPTAGEIFIATSINQENDILEEVAREYQVSCFRGEEEDVLSRFIGVLENKSFDIVVRLTADNPVVDIALLDQLIQHHIEAKNDYSLTTALPTGMNFEIVNADALLELKKQELSAEDKEHVTLFLRKSTTLKLELVNLDLGSQYKNVRTTVDYPSDYLVASALYDLHLKYTISLGIPLIDFAIKEHPYIFEVNQTNFQKQTYVNFSEEVAAAKPILEKFEFKRIMQLLDSKESI